VVIFNDATVERLLTRMKPDVHCKGTDYTVDSVPERAVVMAYGGRTAIVGDPKQHATRDLLTRIRGRKGQEGQDRQEGQEGHGRQEGQERQERQERQEGQEGEDGREGQDGRG
jgi:hypothetical protein